MFYPLSYSYPHSYSVSTLSQDDSLRDSIASSGPGAKSYACCEVEAPAANCRLKKKLNQIELITRLDHHRQPQVKTILPEFAKVLLIASKMNRLKKFDPPAISDPPSVCGRSQNFAKILSKRSKSFANRNSLGAARLPKQKNPMRESLNVPGVTKQLGDYARLSDFDQMLVEFDDDDRMVAINVVVKYSDFSILVNKLCVNSMKTVRQLKLCVANEVPTGQNSASKFAEASKMVLRQSTLPDHIHIRSVPGFDSGRVTLKFLVGEEVNLSLEGFESSPPSENHSDSEQGEISLPPPAHGSDQSRTPNTFLSRAEGSSESVEGPLESDANLNNIDAPSELRPLQHLNIELAEIEEVPSESNELAKMEPLQPSIGNLIQTEAHQPPPSPLIELETNQPEIEHSMNREQTPLDFDVAALVDRFRKDTKARTEDTPELREPMFVATEAQRDFGHSFFKAAADPESDVPKIIPEMHEFWTPGRVAKFFPKLTKEGYKMHPSAKFLKKKNFEELKKVPRFVVENEFGSIEWETPVDLIGVDLNKAVSIFPDGVEVLPRFFYDDENKPPPGSGLNGPAIVNIRGVRFADSNSRTMEEYLDELREACEGIGAEFIEYFSREEILRYRILGSC